MKKQIQINRWLLIYPWLLFIINIISKSFYLTSEEIGLDEPFSIYHAQFNVTTILSQLKNYNNPPLFELLLHYWIKLFGISPLSVRSLPLLFASLSPVTLYYFGKRHFSLSAGIVSSLLLSASSLLFFYAHDCRVYSLFLLLSILSMHLFLMLLSEIKIVTFICFILISTLLIYAHYFGAIILFFQCIYLLVFYRNRILKFSIYFIVIALLYLPHLYSMIARMSESVSHGTWIQPPSGIESLYNMLWSFSNAPVVTVFCLLIFICVLIKAMKSNEMIPNKKVTLLLLWFFLSYLGLFSISYKIPVYISRYLIFVLPAYYLLLANSINYLFTSGKIKITAAIIFVVCFACSVKLNPDKKQHTLEGVSLVKNFKDDSTLVIVSPTDFLASFAYHYNQDFFSKTSDQFEYHLTDSLLKAENIYVVNQTADLNLNNLKELNKIIYFGNGELSCAPENAILKPLMNNYNLTSTQKFSNTSCVFFLTKKNL